MTAFKDLFLKTFVGHNQGRQMRSQAIEMSLRGKAALITGASSGIGYAVAELFSQHGAKIAVVAGRNMESAERLAADIHASGGEAIALQCDVSKEVNVSHLAKKVAVRFGKIDILVNSAGITGPALPVDQMGVSDWDRVFQVNVRGTFLCCKHCIPFMLSQKAGNIINLSSIAGLRASQISPCYSATKGAVISFTRSLALAYAKSGIRVNCICPGTIETPMVSSFFEKERDPRKRKELMQSFRARHPLGGFGKAEDVAYGALYLASNISSFVTGINLVIDGGLSL